MDALYKKTPKKPFGFSMIWLLPFNIVHIDNIELLPWLLEGAAGLYVPHCFILKMLHYLGDKTKVLLHSSVKFHKEVQHVNLAITYPQQTVDGQMRKDWTISCFCLFHKASPEQVKEMHDVYLRTANVSSWTTYHLFSRLISLPKLFLLVEMPRHYFSVTSISERQRLSFPTIWGYDCLYLCNYFHEVIVMAL